MRSQPSVLHDYLLSIQIQYYQYRDNSGGSAETLPLRVRAGRDLVTPVSSERGEEDLRAAEGGRAPNEHEKTGRADRGVKEFRRLLMPGQWVTKPARVSM